MRIKVTCTGTTPLLMHNPRLVDPDYDITRAIKAITSKRKKTDEDLAQVAKLEWFGGLYLEDGVVVQPTAKVRKCLNNAGKLSKLGTAVLRSVSFSSVNVPLAFDGHDIPVEELYGEKYVSRLSVVVGGKRVMRVRPKFFPWELRIDGLFIEDAGLNFDDLERIVELAGVVEGIGDNRVNGYGRFKGKVVQA